MSIRSGTKKLLQRIIRFFFLDTFEFALRPIRVNSELYFWIHDVMMRIPGRIGFAYRASFFGCYFKRRPASLVISAGTCIEHPQGLLMGDGVRINRNVWINAVGGLEIGKNCLIGPGTIIHTANHNFDDLETPIFQQGWTHRPVIIEDDVWLAAAVLVLPGTRIGRGAVIGAGSVVSGTVEPYAIVRGEKARQVKSRMNLVSETKKE